MSGKSVDGEVADRGWEVLVDDENTVMIVSSVTVIDVFLSV